MSGLGEVGRAERVREGRSPDALHRTLLRFNQRRLRPAFPSESWQADVESELRARLLEGEFVEAQRARVATRAAEAPTDADGFVAWFEALKTTGPGQHDPLFPWLATEASLEQPRWSTRACSAWATACPCAATTRCTPRWT